MSKKSYHKSEIESIKQFMKVERENSNYIRKKIALKSNPPISNEPRYFEKSIKYSNIEKQYRLLIHSSHIIDKPLNNSNYMLYFFNIVIRPIHYLEINTKGKILTKKIYNTDDTIYLKAYTQIENNADNLIFIDGADGLTKIQSDFSIIYPELRGIKLGSLAINAIVKWAHDNFPDSKFKDLTLTNYTALIDNNENQKRRDSLYRAVGFDIIKKDNSSRFTYYGLGKKVSEHKYVNSHFGFSIYRIDEEIAISQEKYTELHKRYKQTIRKILNSNKRKINKLWCISIIFIILAFFIGLNF